MDVHRRGGKEAKAKAKSNKANLTHLSADHCKHNGRDKPTNKLHTSPKAIRVCTPPLSFAMADPVSPFSFGYGRRAAATKAESAWKAKQPTFAPEPPTPAKKRNTTTQSGRKVSSSYAEVDSDADWEDEEGEWAERTAPRRQTNAKRKSYKELDSNEDESEEDREGQETTVHALRCVCVVSFVCMCSRSNLSPLFFSSPRLWLCVVS